jgi:hypothetical protein
MDMRNTAFCAMFLLFSVAYASGQSEERQTEISNLILKYLSEGKEDRILPYFDARMAQYLQPAQLKVLWKGIEEASGDFLGAGKVQVVHKNDQSVVSTVCKFEKKKLLFNVTFDEYNKVAGIFFKENE